MNFLIKKYMVPERKFGDDITKSKDRLSRGKEGLK